MPRYRPLAEVDSCAFAASWSTATISIVDIAAALGVSTRSVEYHAIKLGLPVANRQKAQRKGTDAEFIELWEHGVTTDEMALRLGYSSRKEVQQRRYRMGLTKRRGGSGAKLSYAQFLEEKLGREMQAAE